MIDNKHSMVLTYNEIADEARSLEQLIDVSMAGLSRDSVLDFIHPMFDPAWRQFGNLLEDAENINKFGKNGVAQIAEKADRIADSIQRDGGVNDSTRDAMDKLSQHIDECVVVAQALIDSCTHAAQAVHDADPDHLVFTQEHTAFFISNVFHSAIVHRLETIKGIKDA